MAFLTINGLDLPVARNSASGSIELVGQGNRRAYSGDMLTSIRAKKEVLEITTPPLSYEDATFWEGMLKGEGHVFDMEYKGRLGPELIDMDNFPTITNIGNAGGSSGSWNSDTLTLSNTAVGTSAVHPRFRFSTNTPVEAGKRYFVNMQLDTINRFVALSVGVGRTDLFVVPYRDDGVFSGIVKSEGSEITFSLDGREIYDIQIQNLSIRELLDPIPWEYTSKGAPVVDDSFSSDFGDFAISDLTTKVSGTVFRVPWNDSSLVAKIANANNWTLLWYETPETEQRARTDFATPWIHKAYTSADNAYYTNGAVGSVGRLTPSFFSGQLKLDFLIRTWFDNITFLPYNLTPQQIQAIYDVEQGFGPLPNLNVSGDVFGGSSKIMRAIEAISYDYKGMADGQGNWNTNRKIVSATLREV